MQLIWYLPSLVIGLTAGISSGNWQLGLISVLMVTLMASVAFYRNRYPVFDEKSDVMISVGQVAIANRILPRYQFLWKKQWHELLLKAFRTQGAPDFLGLVLAGKKQLGRLVENPESLRMWLGSTSSSELYLELGTAGPHLIIVGPTGSGKSELMKLLVQSLLESENCDLVLFDFKGGATLEAFAPNCLALATDLDVKGQLKAWELVSDELEKRERLFASSSVSSIDQYVAQGLKMRPIVAVVDEFAAALASGTKALQCIEDICARGRSLGVHLIAASQSLTGIPRAMLTNLRARIAMKSSDPIDLVQLGINPNKFSLGHVPGFLEAVLVSTNLPVTEFYFPLGFRTEPRPAASIEAGEPPQPARSQWLRQRYSNPEQEQHLSEEPSSNHDSQLLSRMEGLRWLGHR